jgi:5-formyltetrahydrofolate cyclo-ligase
MQPSTKQQLRKEASMRRAKQPEAERLSRLIFDRVAAMPEFARAKTVLLYLDIRDEVRTQWLLPVLWNEGKRIAVPYCMDGDLHLFRLERLDELSPGAMDVLEPKPELRSLADRKMDPSELDIAIVPGVAFDRRGARLGYGKGYYDRFLHRLRSDAMKLGFCFECQLFSKIPALPHDIPMNRIVTENAVYAIDTEVL